MSNQKKEAADSEIVANTYITNKPICWKCKGTGFKPTKPKKPKQKCTVCTRDKISKKQKPQLRPFKIKDWIIPGPKAKYDINDPAIAPKEGEMLTSLCGHYCIYQLMNGHRMTTDDVCVAAIAIKHAPKKNHLDIGTGLGSVLNIVHWGLPHLNSFGVEAQAIHVELCRKTIEFNGFEARIIHKDLRDLENEKIDLPIMDCITGTPPYFPANTGSLPEDGGRGMCAFELRGGIETYCKVASQYLDKNGCFIVANTSSDIERTKNSGEKVGLHLNERYDFCGIEGKPPLFSVFVFEWTEKDFVSQKINIRDSNGQFSKEYRQMMDTVGKPPSTFEPGTVPKRKN
ncbi:hypothetical protein HDV04_001168 [Boothiomyces sp. JEL0838]|nr:hypothetical protein HDV04_001168 [Boothiomyces sp. JEL0838]